MRGHSGPSVSMTREGPRRWFPEAKLPHPGDWFGANVVLTDLTDEVLLAGDDSAPCPCPDHTTLCDDCGGVLYPGDWPFCKGNPEAHQR